MGFISNAAGKIREFWRGDKERAMMQIAQGTTSPGRPESGYDILQAYGYDILSDYLRLEQDLLSRYVDYEEMSQTAELAAALDIFADDATQPSTMEHRTVWITSPDATIEQLGDDLFHRTLRMDEETWEIAHTTCQYGNDFEEILVGPQGVLGLNFLPPPTVRRVEGPRGELYGFVQDFKGRFGYSSEDFKQILATRTALMQGGMEAAQSGYGGYDKIAALEDWEVVHFRLRGQYRRSVYGVSVFESARWIWKRLVLLEDSALVYRLQRAPERYAFYVDVGNLPPAEALAYMNRIRQKNKKKSYLNNNGRFDLKYDPMGNDEDFYIPVRNGVEGTKIDVLAAPAWQHMEDIEYFRDKLFAAIKVPKAYLAQESGSTKAVLSSEDVRFARSVLRVQRELRSGFGKIFRVHLASLNIDPQKAEYDINMTVPSSIFELAQLEVMNARADLATRMKEFVSLYHLQRVIFGLNDDAIMEITKQRRLDVECEKYNEAVAEAKAAKAAQDFAPQELPAEVQPQESRWRPTFSRTGNAGAQGITEQELFRGSRESEKRVTDKLEQVLKTDRALATRLKNVADLLHDIHGLSSKARR